MARCADKLMADVARLDTPTSAASTSTHTYTVSAGDNRLLIVGVQQEVASATAPSAVTYGGQTMSSEVGTIATGSVDQRVDLFTLDEAGIDAASSSTISVTGAAGSATIHAASYENVDQTTPVPETNTDSTTTSTPNPMTTAPITAGDGSAVVAFAGCGDNTTVTWANVTEQTEQVAATTTIGSLADTLVPSGTTIDPEPTFAAQNRAAMVSLEIAPYTGIEITDSTPSEFSDEDTGIDLTGVSFEASQGTGKVELGDNQTYASANKVEQTITSWADTAIEFTADLGSQSPGTKWLFVTNDSDEVSPGFQVTVHRVHEITLGLSSNIAASGENTTNRLTAPGGKSGTDFDAGRIQDDENPADSVTISADDFTEMEWCIKSIAAAGEVAYDFRIVLDDDTVLDTYSVTPTLTIAAGAFTIDAGAGSYTITGTAAGLELHAVIDAEAGGYTLSGQVANLLAGYNLSTEAASYVLDGQEVSFTVDYNLTAEVGAYILSGQIVNLEYHSVIIADTGSYIITGTDAGLNLSLIMAADAGAYILGGQTTELLHDTVISADTGSYTVNGQVANLELHSVLDAEPGVYILSGQEISLLLGVTLEAEATSYVLSGQEVSLLHAAVLNAESGVYSVIGDEVNLEYHVLLNAESDSYTLNGQQASLEFSAILDAESATYILNGQVANLLFNPLLDVEVGIYTLDGQEATLTFVSSNVLDAEAGSYTLNGQQVSLLKASELNAESAAYLISGTAANLNYSGAAVQGSYHPTIRPRRRRA
jgi:hypothetical protein